MSGYIEGLERALRDAAVRQYGPAADGDTGVAGRVSVTIERAGADAGLRAGLRWRWPPVVAVLAVLALTGSAAAGIVALVGQRSAALSGAVPRIPAGVLRYDVPLTPDLEAGDAGWCSAPRLYIHGARVDVGSEACAPASEAVAPVVVAGGEPVSNASDLFAAVHRRLTSRQGRLLLVWIVVRSQVAAVRIKPGLIIIPRGDPRLPAGWKAIVVFTYGQIDLVPLNRSGHQIPGPAPGRSTAQEVGAAVSPTRTYNLRQPTRSPCAIPQVHAAIVTAQWEVVATRAPALGRTVGSNTLFSCARAWFSIRGQTEAASAALLLNAQNPKDNPPALPGLRPTTQAGIFQADGGASGDILAKRVGRAWLVVQYQSLTTSRALLSALAAVGPAIS